MMPKFDLTGQKFGKLLVVEKDNEKSKNSYRTFWKCLCDCGNTTSVVTSNLRNGHTKSCGCISKIQAAINGRKNLFDLTGKRFGKLTALSYNPDFKKWMCQCDCGKTCYVAQHDLERKKNPTKSCGCLRNQDIANRKNLVEGTNIGSLKNKTLSQRNQTGVRGIHFEKSSGMYVASIGFQGKQYVLKKSTNFEACVEARKKAENRVFGEFLEWYETEYKKEGETSE